MKGLFSCRWLRNNFVWHTLYEVIRGYFPDASPKGAKRAVPSMDLQPVMSFKTRVVQIKELEAGCGISYGHTFITSRKSRIAVLPVGYADGYQRKLSNRAEVLINGRRNNFV